MRFYEFVNIITEDTQQSDILLSTLYSLKKKAEKEGSDGEFQMQSIINQVKSAGADSFVYDNFVDEFEGNPAVKNLVDNYNEQYVTLKLGSSKKSGGNEQQNQQDVSALAKKAVNI